uniref:Uncharacterized protein n=1 Tax=Arion vulgaris TaxID=1028688 RepID=A0A0B7ADR6_9EUPU
MISKNLMGGYRRHKKVVRKEVNLHTRSNYILCDNKTTKYEIGTQCKNRKTWK